MDGLKQVGKYVAVTRKKADNASRNVTQHFPVIERAVGYCSSNVDFIMQFETYVPHQNVTMDIRLQSPTNCSLFVDEIDVTFSLFGVLTVSPTTLLYRWRGMDISSYVNTPSYHTIRLSTPDAIILSNHQSNLVAQGDYPALLAYSTVEVRIKVQ